jgi:hypothetical protein
MLMTFRRGAFPAICIFIALAAARFAVPQISAQQQQPARDLVANFAAGRVEVCSAKYTLLVATADEPIEPGSQPPEIFQLGTGRIGILLGAVEWAEPGSQAPPDNFARDLATVGQVAPGAGTAQAGDEAGDIELLGIALLERIRAQAESFHHKIDLGADEPLVELIVADYVDGYGFEAWLVRYKIKQKLLGNDYWMTTVSRPDYTQLYPPEKGQPRTLIEVRYPPAADPTLLDRLKSDDPGLQRIRDASPKLNQSAAQIVVGESQKSNADDDADFLRAAMPVVTRAEARVALVEITNLRDVVWVAGSPVSTAAVAAPGEKSEPDAPTLYKH